MVERQLFTARLVRALDLSAQTRHFEFEVEETQRFDFLAGQFISMTAARAGRAMTRAYSLASAPHGDNRFDLCLNRVGDGFFSNFLCDLAPGGAVKFHGPHGYFTLRHPVRSALFVATGTGVAPIRGMLQWLFADPQRHAGHEFWLLYGMRTAADIYYRDEFEALAQRHPNFHYLITLSRAAGDWSGRRGYVQEHLPELARDRTAMDAYICGLKDMVTANRALLHELGWERRSILYERFD